MFNQSNVRNVSAYALDLPVWVVRPCDGDLWFYGAYNSRDEFVRNAPAYAAGHPLWVVRECDGDFWFYGAYDTVERAFEVADEVSGFIC